MTVSKSLSWLAPGNLSALFSILVWMFLSSIVIIFNKWILDRFPFAITLTTWHMLCATVATQILSRTTALIDTKSTNIDARTYLTSLVPIGVCFSMSLILSNMVYLYLSVSFVQMLKALGPVATLLACWSIGLRNPEPSLRVLFTVCVIVLGVMIASFGEVRFSLVGFLIQFAAVWFESYKNALQQLLLGGKINMAPLTLLYYYAPICTVTNLFLVLIFEFPKFHADVFSSVSPWILVFNGLLTFTLNIASVTVIKKTSSLVLTLAGIPKAIMLMVLDMLVYHSPMTLVQAIGFSIAGVGTYRYSCLKDSETSNDPDSKRGLYDRVPKTDDDEEPQSPSQLDTEKFDEA